MENSWQTRHTLIQEALDRTDNTVWSELSVYYQPFIRYLLKQMNIPQTDMDDVVQEVLITLWKKLEYYSREKGKFRTWMGTVIRNTAYNHLAKIKQEKRKQVAFQSGKTTDFATCSESEFQQLIDNEWKIYLSNLALQRIGNAFGSNAIQSFLDGMNDIPAAETAKRLGLAIETVYSSRKRVKARMLRELQHLRQELEF
jgi:RNA polymerase sigma-70 factor (ECF subfamily)